MREAVAHGAGQRRPGRRRRRGRDRLGERPRRVAPRRRRHLDHAAEQALLRAAAQQHRAVRRGSARTRRRSAAAAPASRPRAGRSSAMPGRGGGAAARHGQSTQRGRRGVQIVAPRSISAWAKSPARRSGTSAAASARRRGFAAGSGFAHGVEPRDDPLDIAVDRRGRPIEGDRGDRRRGVVADPGQRAQRRRVVGKLAAVPLDDGAGAGVQVAGAGVIAEPLPELQHLVERGRGERANIGPARHESVEIGADSRDRRLLQHDLAEPDAVGVGRLPARRAPRQVAAVAVVPGEQRGGIGRCAAVTKRRFGSGMAWADDRQRRYAANASRTGADRESERRPGLARRSASRSSKLAGADRRAPRRRHPRPPQGGVGGDRRRRLGRA